MTTQNNNQKGGNPNNVSTTASNNVKIGWLIVVLVIIAAIAYAYSNHRNSNYQNTGVATSTIATSTDSGTVAASSTVMSINPSAWQTVSSSTTGITFSYPTAAQLNLSYIQTVNWPPTISVSNAPFTCDQAGTSVGPNGKTTIDVVNNNEYCVNVQSEGAAGSVYTTYSYAFPEDSKTLTLDFTLRSPQCANYPDPQMTACSNEESSFNVDQIADAMRQSIQYVRIISPAQPMTPASSTVLQLNLISPVSGRVGSGITLSGTGFLADNKVLFDGNVAASDAKLSYFNGTSESITITIPSAITPDCKTNQACPMYARLVTPGVYTVSVENTNGTSNTLSFNVTQ